MTTPEQKKPSSLDNPITQSKRTMVTQPTKQQLRRKIVAAIKRVTGGGSVVTTSLPLLKLQLLRVHQQRVRVLENTGVDPGVHTATIQVFGKPMTYQDQRLTVDHLHPMPGLVGDCPLCGTSESTCSLSSSFVQLKTTNTTMMVCVECAGRVGHEHAAVRGYRLRLHNPRDSFRTRVWLASNGFERTATCHVCNTTQLDVLDSDWHVAHDVANALGGTRSVDNLWPTCVSCNLSMGTNTLVEHMQKLNVSSSPNTVLPPQLSSTTVDVLEQHINQFRFK
jgi:5-methylcytosine-specific restriction endonuclease McrA